MNKVLSLILLFTPAICFGQSVFQTNQGSVKFTSDAPLEMIQAQTLKIKGLLNTTERSFAFLLPMSSFEGFNSKLQQTHFNENYIQTDKYPNATFEGKIIEEIDFSVPGTYEVRGKGKFQVHGVEQVRIIRCKLTVAEGKITITSKFTVLLADHNIKIPSVVSKKIAEEIVVELSTTLNIKK